MESPLWLIRRTLPCHMQVMLVREGQEASMVKSTGADSFLRRCVETIPQSTWKSSMCSSFHWGSGDPPGQDKLSRYSVTTLQLLRSVSTRNQETSRWPGSCVSTCCWWSPTSSTLLWRRSPPQTTGLLTFCQENSLLKHMLPSLITTGCLQWNWSPYQILSFNYLPLGEILLCVLDFSIIIVLLFRTGPAETR